MNALRRVVIVGNGIAGVTAADALRTEGFDGDITLVGDEQHPAYSRPALSKALLRDSDDETSHLLPPPGHGAHEIRGVRAVGLDTGSGLVLLEGGDRLGYDGLVIATGCRARRLGEEAGALSLRTLDDALELRHRVQRRPDVIVVGGGPLGMEIASGCLEAGCAVTLVSQGPPLEMQLGAHLSSVLVAAAREQGLRIVLTDAARIVAEGRVRLADDTLLEADLVVTAVGDEPNVEWLSSSGLLADGRLVVDAAGMAAPGVAAVGDVAHVPTPLGVRRLPLWSAAIDQSRVAAVALLGGSPPPHPLPYFWTEQFGLSVKAVGHVPFAGTPELVDGDPDAGRVLLRWASGAAAAVNYRIPIPRLRKLCLPQ